MIDFNNLSDYIPKISFKDDEDSKIFLGLLPIVLGILALLVLMFITEI